MTWWKKKKTLWSYLSGTEFLFAPTQYISKFTVLETINFIPVGVGQRVVLERKIQNIWRECWLFFFNGARLSLSLSLSLSIYIYIYILSRQTYRACCSVSWGGNGRSVLVGVEVRSGWLLLVQKHALSVWTLFSFLAVSGCAACVGLVCLRERSLCRRGTAS